jgi:hypothetical protein
LLDVEKRRRGLAVSSDASRQVMFQELADDWIRSRVPAKRSGKTDEVYIAPYGLPRSECRQDGGVVAVGDNGSGAASAACSTNVARAGQSTRQIRTWLRAAVSRKCQHVAGDADDLSAFMMTR